MLPERLSSTFKTASQGLALQRERITVASQNIANSRTSVSPNSRNGYRSREILTQAPKAQQFFNILEGAQFNLKVTNSKHINSSDGLVRQNGSGLGPAYEVVDQEKFRYEYDPNHPDADENGMVKYPDIDMVKEMAVMVSANRLYEANLSSIEAEKELLKKSLEI